MKINHFLFTIVAATVIIVNSSLASALPVKSQIDNVAQKTVTEEAIIEPAVSKAKLFAVDSGNNHAELNVKSVTDCFYGDHYSLFSPSPLDQIFSIKTVWDMVLDVKLSNFANSRMAFRTKSNWGNENSIMTSSVDTIKVGDAVTGPHAHSIGRMMPWLREGWFDFSLNAAFGMNDQAQHRLRMGALPFALGRGIALGSAYSVTHGFLGFCASNIIDQFPFAYLMSGDIVKKQLTYNVCLEILENFSDRFGRVNQIVYESAVGTFGPIGGERGFGKINFILASNLKWKPLDGSDGFGELIIEPYVMYNHAPEQKVEFVADASSNLGTIGLCFDYTGSAFEFGVDTAFNIGGQNVLGWDRNAVEFFVDSDGVAKNRYTYVRTGTESSGVITYGPQAIQTAGAKKVVNDNRIVRGVAVNGELIGTDTLGVSYYNDINRFRAGYKNSYKGMMLVADAAYNLRADKSFKLVATAAWASGDESPNRDLNNPKDAEVDGDYQGYIGLQEVYAGKRVRSLFVIGNNPIARPASAPAYSGSGVPTTKQVGFASEVSGFTNLVILGGGIDCDTELMGKDLRINSSVISYWQDKATKAFDIYTQQNLDRYANKHLGVEVNAMVRIALLKDLSGFFMGGVFIPGKHYDDIKGTPINRAQKAALNRLNDSGFPESDVPVIGTSTALVLNWGLELCF